ncbi:MAG: GNAT family N-acetyltransferase [Aquihabitans sp.]
MFRVRRIGSDEGPLLRALRLTALADAPGDATTTLARAEARDLSHWDASAAANASGQSQATFVAEPTEESSSNGGEIAVATAVGMVGVYANHDGSANLVGLWAAPGFRDMGVANALIVAAAQWARAGGGERLRFWVVERNEHARRFYETEGFHATGNVMPYELNPRIHQLEMVLAL